MPPIRQMHQAVVLTLKMLEAVDVCDAVEYHSAAFHLLQDTEKEIWRARDEIDKIWLRGYLADGFRFWASSDFADMEEWVSACRDALDTLMRNKIKDLLENRNE